MAGAGGDNDSSSSEDELNPFFNININSLRIENRLENDLFAGQASKMLYYRRRDQINKRFLFNEEAYIYVNYHVRPYLRQIVTNAERIYVWISAKIKFEKILDSSDYVFRWSAHRNRSVYQVILVG